MSAPITIATGWSRLATVFYAIGEKAFKFALVYGIASSLVSVALAANGYPTPDILKLSFVDPVQIVEAVNAYSGTPLFGALLTFGLLGAALLNVFASVAIGYPKVLAALAAAVDPTLVPPATFAGALIQASVYLYLLQTVAGS
jgi:hypothetical protein